MLGVGRVVLCVCVCVWRKPVPRRGSYLTGACCSFTLLNRLCFYFFYVCICAVLFGEVKRGDEKGRRRENM
jgi:hypothetical protein